MIDLHGPGPLLVFGGPYSNLPATRAMQAEAQRLGIPPDRVICTGDVVAYCAEPEETTALVRAWGIHCIAGNCEEQLAAGGADCGCGFEEGSACDLLAKGWYPYANARVSSASRQWMAGLAATLRFRYGGATFNVIHGGVSQTNKFIFASEIGSLRDEASASGAEIIVAGHSGLPFIAKAGHRTWFNPGVIGMPANDGQPSVWFGLITASDNGIKLETRRLAYDHDAAAASLRRSGHANGYARTLITGLWPSLDVLPEVERAAMGKRLRPKIVTVRKAASNPDQPAPTFACNHSA
ncbi:MAG: metallophosphoesterase family protein [Hyphomicrobiaceae bacterium]